MAFYSADPRENIRNAIGWSCDINNDNVERSVISLDDKNFDKIYLPLLLPGEIRTGDMEDMPYIEMTLVSSPAKAYDVGGGVRKQQAYIDFNIWYPNLDNITPTVFGRKVADEIIDRIMTYRSSTVSAYFVEVIDDGREIIESDGKTSIFHRVLSIHTINYE